MVRAKFKCDSIGVTNGYGIGDKEICLLYEIKMSAVIDNSNENKEFFKATPSGFLAISCVNEKAAKSFELNGEYYIDFTKVNHE
jgi:hypothetical protein